MVYPIGANDLITLPHQAEFLSERWLEEARRFFREALPGKKAELGGQPFSVSERFSDAPPHLGFQNNVASWTLRFDGEEVSLEHGFAPDATLTLEADYQAALYLAQSVGLLAQGEADAMWREARHLHGKDAFRLRGRLEHPAAARLMVLFHDHMARRTVENPDIEHRARRLGLVGKIREMDSQGYTIIERAISDDFADEVRAATKASVLPEQGVSMFWMLYQGRAFEKLALNPLLMTLIDASLGRGAVLSSMAAILRGPGPGQIENHTDYIEVPEPYPEYAMTGVGVWAFEDWTEASGPTWIVPGSHRMRRAPRPRDGLSGGVPVEMPKGSVVYFTQGVWHWQGDRTEPGERVTLHPHFNRGILKGLEPSKADVRMLSRNPPRLGEMLGEDDGHQKMIATGRDYLRLEHMRQLHGFTRHGMKAILGEPTALAAE